MKRFLILAFVLTFLPTHAETPTLINKIDPITDKRITTLATRATDHAPSYIAIRCTNDKLEIYFEVKEFLNDDDPVPVTYRFDKDPPVTTKWPVSTDHTGIFVTNPKQFLNAFKGKATLIIRAASYDDNVYTRAFSLNELKGYFTKLPCLNKN